MFCYFKAGSLLLDNGKLAGAQGIQRRLVGLGRNASAAIGSDLNLNFRERSAQHHGVADDADVGAVAVDDDLFDVIHSRVNRLVSSRARGTSWSGSFRQR